MVSVLCKKISFFTDVIQFPVFNTACLLGSNLVIPAFPRMCTCFNEEKEFLPDNNELTMKTLCICFLFPNSTTWRL